MPKKSALNATQVTLKKMVEDQVIKGIDVLVVDTISLENIIKFQHG